MVSIPFRLSLIILLCTAALGCQAAKAQAQISSDPAEASVSGGLVWSADDSLIAVGTTDGLWLHDSADLSLVGQIAAGDTIRSLDVAVSSNRVALGMDDGRIEIWDIRSEVQLLEVIVAAAESFQGPVWFLDWSPDGTLITTHVWGSPGLILDAATGEVILEFADVAFGMTWSPSSDEFAAELENGGGAAIWNIRGERLRRLQDGVLLLSMEWSPDGNSIMGAYREHLYVWRADTGEVEFSTEVIDRQRQGGIQAIAWHPDSTFFALHLNQLERLTSLPGTIQIWSVEDFTFVYELEGVQFVELGLRSIAWNHSGDRFAAVSGDGHLYVWDAETFALLNEYSGYSSLHDASGS